MEEMPVLHTKWCGKHWIHLDEVASTNDYLKQGDFADGTAVIADRQTAGKGRQGKSWSEAPVGQAMYLSVLFHSMKISDMGLLPLLCGLATARSLGAAARIKWPNDVLLGEKKVCGILTEAVTDFESGNIEFAVVGIGLNIFEAADGYPDSLKGIAGGIYENREAAGELDRSRLAAEIVNALLEETRELRLPQEYIEHNLVPGREICISDGDKIRRAKALEICPDGRLKVEEADGSLSVLSYGEVSIII